MTPMAATSCLNCDKDLSIEYELEPLSDHCKHRLIGKHSGDGPCPLCAATRKQLLEDWQRTKPVCSECKEHEEEASERKLQEEKLAHRAARSGMPPNLQGYSWDQLIQSGDRAIAIAAAIAWAQEPDARGIYLWGPSGTGKTRVAATAAWHRLAEGGQALRWVSVAVLLARLEASFSDKDRQAALETLTGDCPLVLDDIDKVNPSESKRAQLFAAIDRRVTAGVPLLVTGNLSPKLLEDKLHGPIASRILGYALGRTFEMDGPDRRMSLDV